MQIVKVNSHVQNHIDKIQISVARERKKKNKEITKGLKIHNTLKLKVAIVHQKSNQLVV